MLNYHTTCEIQYTDILHTLLLIVLPCTRLLRYLFKMPVYNFYATTKIYITQSLSEYAFLKLET
jgi:hypothetical protein